MRVKRVPSHHSFIIRMYAFEHVKLSGKMGNRLNDPRTL